MNPPAFPRAASKYLAPATLLAAALTLGPQNARPAEASCLAPRDAIVRTVRVTRCEVIDPLAQSQVRALVDAMTQSGRSPDEVQRFIASYRGVLIDGVVVRSVRRPVHARPPARSVSSYPLATAVVPNASYFHPTLAANACGAFASGTTIAVYELASCCDGDPGVPCLLRAGTVPLPHAAAP